MKFIQQMFSDVDEQGSQKRLVTFGIFLLLATITIGVTFFHATFNEVVWTDLCFLLGAGLGVIASEKFTKRGMRNDQTADQPKQ